jgi:putative membrane protein
MTARHLTDVLRGFLMGCAEVVPGISGGTVALIVGIYDRLLGSMSAAVKLAVAILRRDAPARRAAWAEIDFRLLIPLLAGMAVALLIGARVIPPLLERYPEGSSALFFGLILGSLVVPWRMWEQRRGGHWPVLLVATLLAFLLTGIPEREIADPAKPAVFFAAAIAICALTLPGVSGSYLLLAMGLYAPTLAAVDNRDIGYLAVFAAGALVGLALFARTLSHLLLHHRNVTVAALLGLMIGSLRALWPWSTEDGTLLAPPAESSEWLPILLMALLGVAVVATLLVVNARARGAAAPGR